MTRENISVERIKPESTFVALQDLAFIPIMATISI
ncbi:hypothetical protein TorRG33x02_037990 [Trema orientale]|uniref:Uncharacterized protein n=1 Tax=Trema orientale TaxID=63057 RepID=A0A2P5FRG1_TREOI|nr:hypothetical protein TorRG33x02_037990 [Trema orientale]